MIQVPEQKWVVQRVGVRHERRHAAGHGGRLRGDQTLTHHHIDFILGAKRSGRIYRNGDSTTAATLKDRFEYLESPLIRMIDCSVVADTQFELRPPAGRQPAQRRSQRHDLAQPRYSQHAGHRCFELLDFDPRLMLSRQRNSEVCTSRPSLAERYIASERYNA